MTRHDIGYVAKTAAPMFLIMVAMAFILIAAPELATWLPENMRAAPGGRGAFLLRIGTSKHGGTGG